MNNNFLAINKEYLGIGLKSIDILLIAQVEEFQRNNHKCYITNKQFAEMFGESESTIKRAIDKLEEANILKRATVFVDGNGRSTRQRTLSVHSRKEWKVQNEPTKPMEGSKNDNGRFKNQEWKVQNEPTKDNIKDNIKDNLIGNETPNGEEREGDLVEGTLYDKRLEGIWLTQEEAELLEMNMTTVEELLGEQADYSFHLYDKADGKERFIADEKERLGSEVVFVDTEWGMKSYLGEKCMGQLRLDLDLDLFNEEE